MERLSRNKARSARILILGLAAAGILTGMSLGEPDIILHKAVILCLECIGIG